MAVDSKPGETNGAAAPASDAAAALARRRKSSSLMQAASSLPSVEHSLEEFIAKANQSLVDVNTWTQAETAAREEDERRREQDAQRWKQAEIQLRESDEREQLLRKQLDGLQGKLAEAEARAAVALSTQAASANDAMIAELKEQIAATSQQSERLSIDLTAAQQELKKSRMTAAATAIDDATAAERVRLAEAKAAKALAAARAAAAGLTVSTADLAAIENGLVVVEPKRRAGPPVVPIMLAFAGGIAIMFAVWKLALVKDDPDPAQQAAPAPQQQAQQPPAPAPAPTPPPAQAPVHPTVTPIDETAAAPPTPAPTPAQPTAAPAQPPAPAPAPAPAVAKPGPTVTPIEEPVPAVKAPEPAPAPAPSKPAPRKVRPAAPAHKAEPKDKNADKPPGGIIDPF